MNILKKMTTTRLSAKEMVSRYTDQPNELPLALKDQLKKESIQVYAYVDFDNTFKLSEGLKAAFKK